MAAPVSPNLPTLEIRRGANSEEVAEAMRRWSDDLVGRLQSLIAEAMTPAGQTGYTVIGGSPSRTLDLTAPTAATVGNVLAAIIDDLQTRKVVS